VTRAAQERLWLLEELNPGSPLNVVAAAVELPPGADLPRLEAAFGRVLEERPDLRTSYAWLAEGLHGEARPAHVAVESLPGDGDVHALAAREALRPLDLTSGSLLRAGVAARPDGTAVLVVSAHAIACGEGTLRGLCADVVALATGGSAAAAVPAAPAEPTGAAGYWQARLAGAPAVDLPADRQRPGMQSFAITTVSLPVDRGVRAALHDLAGREGVSLEAVAVAAASLFVERHTGIADVVLAVGDRTSPLLARVELDLDATVASVVGSVQAELDTAAAQALAFDRLVELLEPERDLSRAPLAQVFVSADVQRSGAAVAFGGSVYDLEIALRDDGADAVIRVAASSDLFDRETAEEFARRYATLLDAMAREPRARVLALPFLDDAERAELERWNATETPFPQACLHALVAEQAARTPDRIAVEDEAESMTYRELETRASALAAQLAELGIGRGSLVGLCVPRTARLLVGLLGILKTGAAYVPVDPSYPAARVALMLDDADAPVIVSDRSVTANLPASASILFLDDLDAEAGAFDADGEPEDAAYVIYTSGSTGRPKGVRVPHRAVVNLLWAMRREPGLATDGVVVNLTTYAFDLSVPDLYLPLVLGAKLVVASADVAAEPDRLAALLDRSDATLVQATPTTWQMLVDAGWRGSSRLRVACGGEAVPAQLVTALRDRSESAWHMYGPTETCVWSSIAQLEVGDGPPSLGGPIANTRFSIVDGHGRIVPTGIPGELVIGGAGVAHGYHARPELTAERFVDDPSRPGAVAYRTGDLVRRRRDGSLDFLGRADGQVKLRGFRIELGEIETMLCSHPSIAQAVVTKHDDPVTGPRLVAYVVPTSGSPDVPALRDRLRESLPEYMVPGSFVALDELPRTTNGKIDRGALTQRTGDALVASPAFVEPRTPIERLLAGVWCDVLGLDRVGVADDFFELGGNSLLLARVNARLGRTLGVRLPLRRLFELRTLGAVAAEVVGSLAEDADAAGELLDALEAEVPA
jgi:amino acid adenylation domain-containing protein